MEQIAGTPHPPSATADLYNRGLLDQGSLQGGVAKRAAAVLRDCNLALDLAVTDVRADMR